MPSFNINEFTSELEKRGVAKSHNFSVIITPPVGVRDLMGGMDIPKWLPLRVEAVNMPARSLMTLEQRYHGPIRYMPYSMIYTPVTLTVILSDNMVEREFFMAWQDLAVTAPEGLLTARRGNNGIGKYDSSYYEESVGTITIQQFAETPQAQGVGGGDLFDTIIGTAQSLGFDPSVITNPIGIGGTLDSFGLENPFKTTRTVTPNYTIQLNECYPRTVNEVAMNWGTEEIAKLQIEIIFFDIIEHHKEPELAGGDQFSGLPGIVREGVRALGRIRPIISGISDGTLVRSVKTNIGSQLRNVGSNLKIF